VLGEAARVVQPGCRRQHLVDTGEVRARQTRAAGPEVIHDRQPHVVNRPPRGVDANGGRPDFQLGQRFAEWAGDAASMFDQRFQGATCVA
jgi:hypothetical protein